MKKFLFLILSVSTLLTFNSCKKETSTDKEITLVMAEVNPEGTISAEMDKAFKQKVEELSNGKIKIDLHCGATLGDEENIMSIITSENPSIQLERISAFSLVSRGCTKSSLLVIPFTFENKNHFWTFATSNLSRELLDEPYEKKVGVKGLFYGEEGFRHFFANKKLSSPKDFENIKLRISSDPIMKGVSDGLKANSTSIPFGELYMALQTGVAEAAEQPIANYLANHFHQVAPYMVLDGHTLGITEVIISSKCWDSLSENQKHILKVAGEYAGEFCRKISQEAEDAARKQLIAEGAVFTEVSDLSEWKNASSEIISESAKIDESLYQQIVNLAKQE